MRARPLLLLAAAALALSVLAAPAAAAAANATAAAPAAAPTPELPAWEWNWRTGVAIVATVLIRCAPGSPLSSQLGCFSSHQPRARCAPHRSARFSTEPLRPTNPADTLHPLASTPAAS